jgi:serine/threonine protein kinase
MKIPFKQGDVFLGKYVIGRELGRGGMGVVIAARHLQLDELFAIKFLLSPSDTDLAVQRFTREARASAQLKSEHVVRVHDVGQTDKGISYMIMEHLEGSDLRAVVRDAGPLPIADVIDYSLQACDALAAAHANGFIHRDVKSANLFLTTRANGTACVKLLDFGILKHIDSENIDLTQTDAILGSPLYMSPEQMLRMKDIDARTDIWSMGVIMYELLSGRRPFEAKTLVEAVARVTSQELTPLRSLRSEISEDLDAVVTKCLCKNRDERYHSILELAEDLERVRASKRVLARGVRLTTLRMPDIKASPPSPAQDQLTTDLRDEPLAKETSWGSVGKVVSPRPSKAALMAGITAAFVMVAVGLGLFLGHSSNSAVTSDVAPEATTVRTSPPERATVSPGMTANAMPTVQPLASVPRDAQPARPAVRPAARLAKPSTANPTSTKKSTKPLYSNDD